MARWISNLADGATRSSIRSFLSSRSADDGRCVGINEPPWRLSVRYLAVHFKTLHQSEHVSATLQGRRRTASLVDAPGVWLVSTRRKTRLPHREESLPCSRSGDSSFLSFVWLY